MGYTTSFKLEFQCSDEKKHEIEQFYIDQIDEYGFPEEDDPIKFYSWKEDFIKLSKKFADVKFTIIGVGEDEDDHWKAFFHEGHCYEIYIDNTPELDKYEYSVVYVDERLRKEGYKLPAVRLEDSGLVSFVWMKNENRDSSIIRLTNPMEVSKYGESIVLLRILALDRKINGQISCTSPYCTIFIPDQ